MSRSPCVLVGGKGRWFRPSTVSYRFVGLVLVIGAVVVALCVCTCRTLAAHPTLPHGATGSGCVPRRHGYDHPAFALLLASWVRRSSRPTVGTVLGGHWTFAVSLRCNIVGKWGCSVLLVCPA